MEGITGLIFGGFTDMKDTERPFGKTMDEILQNISAGLEIPVCFQFPVSHETENYALKCGLEHKLTITNNKVKLEEVQL